MLESFGYKVILAIDGQDGLDKFIEHKELIDLVLLDLTMPRKSGKELLSEISKIKEEVNVIICS
jgi:two-component system, cell cycle sensor histidine kinase and response regulator CckA